MALHVVVVVQALLSLAKALLFLRLTRMMGLHSGLLGLAVILTYLLGTGLYGSEAQLNALMLAAALLSLWHALGRDHHWAWLGRMRPFKRFS